MRKVIGLLVLLAGALSAAGALLCDGPEVRSGMSDRWACILALVLWLFLIGMIALVFVMLWRAGGVTC